jgi:probable phosphoglycerate mutase
MKTVYLVRHGQTEWNLAKRLQGRLDSPLTELGVQQARASAEVVAARGVDALYCSPLGRALATAEHVADACGLPIEVLDDLAEVSAGELEGATMSEFLECWPDEAAARKLDRYRHRWPGGESYVHAAVRARAALAVIEAAGHERVVIVSHGQLGRLLLAELVGWTPEESLAYVQANDAVVQVDVPAQTWRRI